jgi:hypothetical protein
MERVGVDDIKATERRAEARARASASGIGAAIAERLPAGGDGRERFRVRLADGRYFGWLEVAVGPEGPSGPDLEAAIEHCAGNLPVDGRLDALEALSPIVHLQ